MRFALLLGILLSISSASAQALFEAYADAQRIFADSYFEVRFTLKNGEGTNFRAPDFADFIVLSGPARSMSTTVINGQVSKALSYVYTLQPKRSGRLTIGSASITVNGQILRTERLSVEVVARTDSGGKSGRQFFVAAVPSATEAYVGQQIRLDYRLYTQVEIQNYNIVEEPDYVGFFASDIRRPDTRLKQEIIEGNQYYTRTLKSVALYPQQAGTLTIPPAIMQLGVVTGEDDGFSLFLGNNIRRVPVRTDSLIIEVAPLPRPVPDGFTGAVGTFRLRSSVNRNTLTTDDALSLTMEVSGNGDMKRVRAPDPDMPPSFDTYDPEVEEYDLGELNGFQQGQKVFTFLAQPREAGMYQLQPRFVFFDPDSARFRTLAPDTVSLTIRQGTRTAMAPEVTDDLALGLEDVGPLRLNTHLRKKGEYVLIGTPVFWTITTLPGLLFLGFLVYRRQQKQQKNVSEKERKSRAARKIAMERLEIAKGHMQNGQHRPFYDEVSKAMLGYVSDKLNIPGSELTKNKVRHKLAELSLEQRQIDRFVRMLQDCEMALFAGVTNREGIQQTYRDSLQILSWMEEHLPSQTNRH